MGEAINLVNNFKVEKVIFNCGEFNELEQDLIKVLDKKKIRYYSCIKELNIDNNKLYFLNNKNYSNENDNSSVIYTELNNHKFLFMGDAGVEVEEDLIGKYNLQDIDVLKVGHHGSKTSSSKIFINEINPNYSIISVGKKNRYGHPNDIVLDNLEDSKIYRTDQDGSIMYKIKNNKLKIKIYALEYNYYGIIIIGCDNMKIYNIDLTKTNLFECKYIVAQCQEIINENLEANGGNLKVSNIFERDYNWTNLIIVFLGEKIIGFALIRLSAHNDHDLRESIEYYYLSDVVVKKIYQKQGVGTLLMGEVMSCTKDKPLVASCLKDNDSSLGLLSKFMICYGASRSGKYLRFVDNKFYAKLYGDNVTDSQNMNGLDSSKKYS